MSWRVNMRRLLFPRVRCLSCNEPRAIDVDEPLCDRCERELADLALKDGICSHCLSPVRSGDPCRHCADGGMEHLRAAYAPFRYHGPAQRLVWQLKYGGVYYAADPLVDGMVLSLAGARYDALVPVPMYPSEQRSRGFNQAAVLADKLAERGAPPVLHALIKVMDTKRQSTLSNHLREENVRDAFRVSPGCDVRGLHLLLVDDVRTTGSTARSCAGELRKAGAAGVSLLTATVAAPYGDKPSSKRSA